MNTNSLAEDFIATRRRSLEICAPLEKEDYGLQAATFASPPKWHLAHTTWFFETFLLKVFAEAYEALDARYEVLFNSYYNGIGEQHPRDRRGLLSRPLLEEVLDYRRRVEAAVLALLEHPAHAEYGLICERVTLGIEHERQHQELFFTDIKYSLSANPLYPIYQACESGVASDTNDGAGPATWTVFDEALIEVGHSGEGFCFDNELPRHQVFTQAFELADRLVTNGEFQAFIDDGGYSRSDLWLADGWAMVQAEGWSRPLNWVEQKGDGNAGKSGALYEFTLHGLQTWDPVRPVCHVSGYEADAFASWAKARLPTEAEWERAAVSSQAPRQKPAGHGVLQPEASEGGDLDQLYGACWQWTRSAYGPYPGFKASSGAIGEYNGKFMSNQWVLRGSSCVTPPSQARETYRNFFYPQDRWQFSGIRLAR
ncbi:MAG: ergothioneine biosynthesis protein EgtB [Congregibacter sp.]